MREPWIGSFARRIVALICGGFACEAFTRRSSVALRRSDKEIHVFAECLGRNGLDVMPVTARIDSEHAR